MPTTEKPKSSEYQSFWQTSPHLSVCVSFLIHFLLESLCCTLTDELIPSSPSLLLKQLIALDFACENYFGIY